jgi:hypothetical protein
MTINYVKRYHQRAGKTDFFSKNYYEKHNLSEVDRIRAQSDRGKRGSRTNAGFIWYNDGVSSFKYNKSQQDKLPFDEFIANNKHFKRGRLRQLIKRIWVNYNGENHMIAEDCFNQNIHKKGRINRSNK